MGVIWETSVISFTVMVVLLGGGAAYMSGRAVARGWKPIALVFFYCLLLAFVTRFLQYALREGTLLSLHYLAVNYVVLIIWGLAGFRIERTRQMVTQYSWLNSKSGPLSWNAVEKR